jgi:hypothetical protein
MYFLDFSHNYFSRACDHGNGTGMDATRLLHVENAVHKANQTDFTRLGGADVTSALPTFASSQFFPPPTSPSNGNSTSDDLLHPEVEEIMACRRESSILFLLLMLGTLWLGVSLYNFNKT